MSGPGPEQIPAAERGLAPPAHTGGSPRKPKHPALPRSSWPCPPPAPRRPSVLEAGQVSVLRSGPRVRVLCGNEHGEGAGGTLPPQGVGERGVSRAGFPFLLP